MSKGIYTPTYCNTIQKYYIHTMWYTILGIWISLYVWIWFMQFLYTDKIDALKISLKIFVLVSIGIGAIIGGNRALQNWILSNHRWYIGVVSLITNSIRLLGSKKIRQYVWPISIITTAILLLWFGIQYRYLSHIVIGATIISVIIEEAVKSNTSDNIPIQTKSKRNYILSWLLIWLAFSLIENILYSLSFDNISIILSRTVTTGIIHMTTTGIIAYFALKWNNKRQQIGYTTGGIILWICIHSIYNISLQNSSYIRVVLCIITWYFIVSYLVYQSDALYTNNKE